MEKLVREYVFPSSGVLHDLFFRRWHLNFCLHFDVKSNHSNASLPLASPYIIFWDNVGIKKKTV